VTDTPSPMQVHNDYTVHDRVHSSVSSFIAHRQITRGLQPGRCAYWPALWQPLALQQEGRRRTWSPQNTVMKAGAGSIYLPPLGKSSVAANRPNRTTQGRTQGAQITKDFKVDRLPPVTTRYPHLFYILPASTPSHTHSHSTLSSPDPFFFFVSVRHRSPELGKVPTFTQKSHLSLSLSL
jgi:hypothetical protein